MTDAAPIAVVVLGGYLGAGKTTLVNHLLRTSDQRTVVLVNDFGDLAIDPDLIESNDGDTLTLANGCVCCSLVDGFATALDEIRQLEPRPARLVIETSGVADPGAVAAYAHRRGYRLDLVVVLADAEQIEANLADRYVGETVRRQLAAGDVVVLNKIDLVDDTAPAEDAIRAVVGDRPVVAAEHAAVASSVLDVDPRPGRPGEAVHAGFETWTATWDATIGLDDLERHVAALPVEVVRVKGVVDTDAGPRVVHRVGPRVTLAAADSVDRSRLVAIGLPGAIIDDDLQP